MPRIDIPFGSALELSARIKQLADDVLNSDPWTRKGLDARRLLQIALRQLELKAKISPDPLLDACLYDVACKVED